jgi:hypothetical protein
MRFLIARLTRYGPSPDPVPVQIEDVPNGCPIRHDSSQYYDLVRDWDWGVLACLIGLLADQRQAARSETSPAMATCVSV